MRDSKCLMILTNRELYNINVKILKPEADMLVTPNFGFGMGATVVLRAALFAEDDRVVIDPKNEYRKMSSSMAS
ncbi:hypothetical protein SMD22_01555 (plasmid) [Brevibacillus halotolerans]|nr:hypothetical protein SMD22_01555 [Brevibacillus halotolerans]